MSSVIAELERQRLNNVQALSHFESFAAHRQRLTSLARQAESDTPGRLCVLGAGNCYDLDLDELAQCYTEIHLVDLDEQALSRVVARQQAATRARIVAHPRLDLTGMLEQLERWKNLQVTEQEVVGHAQKTATRIRAQVGGSFDTVLSACVLSQMQLSILNVLSDKHPLFQALCHTLTLTHLRTMLELTQPEGRAVFATDVTSDEIAPLKGLAADQDLQQLLTELMAKRDLFNVIDPRTIQTILADDPILRRDVTVTEPRHVWLWHNGPLRVFLVYALELRRNVAQSAGAG